MAIQWESVYKNVGGRYPTGAIVPAHVLYYPSDAWYNRNITGSGSQFTGVDNYNSMLSATKFNLLELAPMTQRTTIWSLQCTNGKTIDIQVQRGNINPSSYSNYEVTMGSSIAILYDGQYITGSTTAQSYYYSSDHITTYFTPYISLGFDRNPNGDLYIFAWVTINPRLSGAPASSSKGVNWGCYVKVSYLLGTDNLVFEEISPESGEPSAPGGYTGGGFDASSDTIGVPTAPSIGVTNVGFVNVYNPTQGGLQNLGADLFPDFTWEEPPTPSGSDIIDAVNALAQGMVNISKNIPNAIDMYINSNLVNYIIDCHVLPVAPAVGASQQIKVGFKTFSQAAPVVTSDYVDFDCGSLQIGEYYHNFLDYQTRARLYLPFVGFVPIQPELFQDGTLQVKYRFNVIDGSFMAFVLSTSSKSNLKDTVVGSYGGNACIHIPITGINYSNMVSGIVSGAGAAVSALSGNVGGAVTSALNTLATKPDVQTSNAYNASTAFLGVRTPYLLIERPVSNFPRNYASESGIPSNITVDFATLHGFTVATNVHLDGILCTDEEKTLLQDALAAGVIL